MRTAVVDEYARCREPDLEPSAADLAAAESADIARRITLRWLRGSALEIEAGSHVGVIHLDCALCAPGGFGVRTAAERLAYDRANEHYRNAHRWARMLLEGTSFRSLYARTGGATHAFMIDMNALFEDFVTRLLRDAFTGSDVAVRAQEHLPGAVRGETGSYTSITPDVQLVRGQGANARRCSVDAKYKLYADKKVAASDLFQSFVYAQAVGGSEEPPTAFILYAGDRDAPPRTVGLHRGDGNIAARVTYVAVNVPAVLRPGETREALFARLRELVRSGLPASLP